MRDDAQPHWVDPQVRQRLAAVLAVHDDAGEPLQQRPPQVALRRRPARKEVVGGEDRRPVHSQHAVVDLGRREPLVVDDLPAPGADTDEADRVLGGLERKPGGASV